MKPDHFKFVPNGEFTAQFDQETGEFVGLVEGHNLVRVRPDEAGYEDAPWAETVLFHPMIFSSPPK